MSKKVLFVALAALGLSSTAALANVNSTSSNPNVYVGIQAGYGDTNWSDTDTKYDPSVGNFVGLNSKDGVFAGRIFTGYNFNQYLAVEGGYTYFGNTKTTVTVPASFAGNFIPLNTTTASGTATTKTYGLDLVGRINVPVTDGFGLYAKAGPGYLHSSTSGFNVGTDTAKNVDLVFGGGADYQIGQNLVADVSFTRFNGNHKIDSNNYQPNADLYAVGLAYKFNV